MFFFTLHKKENFTLEYTILKLLSLSHMLRMKIDESCDLEEIYMRANNISTYNSTILFSFYFV
jgi:hypothetical protein